MWPFAPGGVHGVLAMFLHTDLSLDAQGAFSLRCMCSGFYLFESDIRDYQVDIWEVNVLYSVYMLGIEVMSFIYSVFVVSPVVVLCSGDLLGGTAPH